MPENPTKPNIIYLMYMYKEYVALNNLQWLICNKTKSSQTNQSKILFVCSTYIIWLKQFKLWKVSNVVSSITVVGVLTCALVLSMCESKATQMNVQHSLIHELILYKFKLGYNSAEVTKNICWVKGESAVENGIVIRWFKKFHSDHKNLNDQARLDRPKTMDSKAMFKLWRQIW